jgi:hypothetical protein
VSGQLERALGVFARLTRRFRVWYRLPFIFAIPTLLGLRVNMREHNLFDTERDPSLLKPKPGGEARDIRQADGSYNDMGGPWMGMANARFGRNFPIGETHGETEPGIYRTNQRLISRKLLERKSFVPVMCWPPPGCNSWCMTGSATDRVIARPSPIDCHWMRTTTGADAR